MSYGKVRVQIALSNEGKHSSSFFPHVHAYCLLVNMSFDQFAEGVTFFSFLKFIELLASFDALTNYASEPATSKIHCLLDDFMLWILIPLVLRREVMTLFSIFAFTFLL